MKTMGSTSSASPVAGQKQKHDDNLGTLYFDAQSDSEGHQHIIHHRNLLEKFDEITGTEPDNILWVSVYKSPLSSWQVTNALFYHAFLLYETDNWYYSMETSDKNITLQRSKQLTFVRDQCLRRPRSGTLLNGAPSLVIKARGQKTIRDVMQYLYERGRLKLEYNLLVENCKDLAKKGFDKFNSEGKSLNLIFTSY